MKLLKQLCQIHGPSGNESKIKDFILNYIDHELPKWKIKPEIHHGDDLQDNIILVFGEPQTAIFTHMDTTGFTVRYENQLIPVGSPEVESGYVLTGSDSLGSIECKLRVNKDNKLFYEFGRGIHRGTDLVFKSDFKISGDTITSPYLDNRLGVYVSLKLAETLENGIIAFTTWEEHGGGSIPVILRFLDDRYKIKQVLICDITWVTDGIHPGEGVVISMRDQNIPRRKFIDRIINITDKSQIPYQLEVESGGSSDGREIQVSPYPIDWCFVGVPEDHAHSPYETVNKNDIDSMIDLYKVLLKEL